MKRYWIKFDLSKYDNMPFGVVLGCGITAYNYEDALIIAKTKIFKDECLPLVLESIEDVDISTLDKHHVLPNMNPPIYRGIWFPIGYD